MPNSTYKDRLNCFLSCSFRDEDRPILTWFKDFIESFPDFIVILANTGIPIPTEQSEGYMDECDLACFVITSREGSVSPWVLQEVEIARKKNLTLFAFVEEGLSLDKLGTLPSYIAFQWFDREKLAYQIPLYVRYTYNARTDALKKQRIDRKTLIATNENLRATIARLRTTIDLLEDQLKPRMFDL